MNTALTIAGSDCSGGAGIQADIKTMTVNGVYAMSVITSLTAQNTTGVTGILDVTPDFLKKQIDAVFTDIFPDAVKIGMVSSPDLIDVICERLAFYGARNIVVDPVMVATSGASLITDEAREVLVQKLFPIASLITPNIPEAEILSNMKIESKADMEEAARRIGENCSAVLLKGGHSICDADDYLWMRIAECEEGVGQWFPASRVDNPNTHGTGCTLSSAIATYLAKGKTLPCSVKHAKKYVAACLAAGLDLGKGSGPLMHNFALVEENRKCE
ncbi:MAG: bifunctional hydroxymethylpyrimidine kinase/phosphomethylpyrimidine kinase [Clostridiales bacterium]|nr:bifunctional hydroxymethylpyrimidine kinase/phosphomethylpyrimidine kinase [Clostridiales bacterium]